MGVTIGYLYRGVNIAQHERDAGRILPRAPGRPFEHVFILDGTFRLDGSATFGPSAQNAVLAHQLGLPDRPDLHTSGISTTPNFGRALLYATHTRDDDGGWTRRVAGVVYVIDRARLASFGVEAHAVADTVAELSVTVPDDDEVILHAPDNGELPTTVVVEVRAVSPTD